MRPAALTVEPLQELLSVDPSQPLDVLQYLLRHPVVTLVASGVVLTVVPRLVKFAVRTAALLGLAFLLVQAFQAEDFVPGLLHAMEDLLSAALGHPIATSAVILTFLALALSPYLLLGLLVLVIAGGVQLAPPQAKLFLPQPLRQAEEVIENMQETVREPVKQVSDTVSATKRRVEEPIDKAKEATRNAVRGVQDTAGKVESTIESVAGCTKLPSPELRAACVQQQNK